VRTDPHARQDEGITSSATDGDVWIGLEKVDTTQSAVARLEAAKERPLHAMRIVDVEDLRCLLSRALSLACVLVLAGSRCMNGFHGGSRLYFPFFKWVRLDLRVCGLPLGILPFWGFFVALEVVADGGIGNKTDRLWRERRGSLTGTFLSWAEGREE